MLISNGTRMMTVWRGRITPCYGIMFLGPQSHIRRWNCVADFGWLAASEEIQSEGSHINETACWRGTGPGLLQRDTRVGATLMTDKQITSTLWKLAVLACSPESRQSAVLENPQGKQLPCRSVRSSSISFFPEIMNQGGAWGTEESEAGADEVVVGR